MVLHQSNCFLCDDRFVLYTIDTASERTSEFFTELRDMSPIACQKPPVLVKRTLKRRSSSSTGPGMTRRSRLD
jgi:hypothetical protein